MSSFFTLPASQKKRKRSHADAPSRGQAKTDAKRRSKRDDSISGSDVSDDEGPTRRIEEDGKDSDNADEDFEDEDTVSKRIRLAEQYLANTQKEVLEDVGFDAVDVDVENLRRRMGERLKEDTAETKGRLYRWIAEDFDWTRSERAQFRHHKSAVTGVAVSGKFAYSVGKDGILVKWQLPEPEDAEAKNKFPRPSRKPRKMKASRNFGKNTNSMDSDQHTMAILCVAASQDGRFVATGGADKKLIVWDADTLKPLKVFLQHRDAVLSLAFRRGTNQLFSASADRTVKTWSLNELAYVETLFGHQDHVVDVGALAQEVCVTVGARDRTARLWKVVEESQLVFRGGGAPSKSKSARHGNEAAASLGEDPPHEGSTDRVACIDDETFITGSDNGSLSLWNMHKKKAVHIYPLAHGLDPPLPLEEVSAEFNPPKEARTQPTPRWITALRAIPFSNLFISGSWDGYIRVWKLSQDKRKIESLGCVGPAANALDQVEEGLGVDATSKEVLKTLQNGTEGNAHLTGIINDLAILDNGDRAKDGLLILAAIGKSHRLGRWQEIRDATNRAILFEVPRKALDSVTLDEATDDGEEGFEGLD